MDHLRYLGQANLCGQYLTDDARLPRYTLCRRCGKGRRGYWYGHKIEGSLERCSMLWNVGIPIVQYIRSCERRVQFRSHSTGTLTVCCPMFSPPSRPQTIGGVCK